MIVRNGKKKDGGDDLGQDQVAGRVDAHDLQRVDLFGDAHRADFGGDVRPHFAGEDQRDDRRRELQQHRLARGIADQVFRNERRLQVQRHLDRDYGAHEHRDDRDDADRVEPEARHLDQDPLAVDRELLRTGEGLAHQHEVAPDQFKKVFHPPVAFRVSRGRPPVAVLLWSRTGRRTGRPVVLLLCRSVVFFRCRFPLPFAQKHAQFPFPFLCSTGFLRGSTP